MCALICRRPGRVRLTAVRLATVLLFCCFISLTGSTQAQTTPEILLAGRVTDSVTGEPVAGANIYIQNGTSGTVSVAGGYFTLQDVPSNDFTLVITHVGYEQVLVPVDTASITAGVEIEVTLEPTLYLEDEIVVTASRYSSDVHLTHTNLTQQAIRVRKSDVSIPVLLEDTPGLFAYSDAGNAVGYSYLKIRGFDQRRVGVLVNGIPLNDPEDHQVYWVDLPDFESSLQDIQIQRGVTNSVGGVGAIGGSVNLLTDLHPVLPSGYFFLGAGSFGTAKQTFAYRSGMLGGKFSTVVRFSHLQSNGFRDRSASDQWAAYLSGRYEAAHGSLQLNIYTGNEMTQQAWLAADEQTLARNRKDNPETYHNAIDNFRQPHYELFHEWNISPTVNVLNSFYWIHGEGYYENRTTNTARHYSLDHYFGLPPDSTLNAVQQLWVSKDQVGWLPQLEFMHSNGRLLLGGDVYGFQSHHWGDVMMADAFTPTDFVDGLKFHDFNGDKVAWSVFANERRKISDRLTLLLDLQYQHREYELKQNRIGNFQGTDRHAFRVTYDFFNPKGGFHWRVAGGQTGSSLGFYGYVGKNQLEPSLYDLFDTWLGPEVLGVAPLFERSTPVFEDDGVTVAYLDWSGPIVQPEEVINYEAGAAIRTGFFTLTVNGYWMDSRNEIVPFGGIYLGYAIKGNAEKTWHRGIELDLKAQLLRRHTLIVAASRSWDRYERFIFHENVYDENWNLVGVIERDYSGNPIALFPQYLGSVIWRADWTALQSMVRYRVVGKQYLDNTGREERTIDPYYVWDLGLTMDLGRLLWHEFSGAKLRLQVRNLLDAEYETNGYYDDWYLVNRKIPGAERNYWVGLEYDF